MKRGGGRGRVLQSAVSVAGLEDAWRHGASPTCLEMGWSELGRGCCSCLRSEPFVRVGSGGWGLQGKPGAADEALSLVLQPGGSVLTGACRCGRGRFGTCDEHRVGPTLLSLRLDSSSFRLP